MPLVTGGVDDVFSATGGVTFGFCVGGLNQKGVTIRNTATKAMMIMRNGRVFFMIRVKVMFQVVGANNGIALSEAHPTGLSTTGARAAITA